jgi:hypothetical protein
VYERVGACVQVDEAERKRDEELRRKGGAGVQAKSLNRGFNELIAKARQAKQQQQQRGEGGGAAHAPPPPPPQGADEKMEAVAVAVGPPPPQGEEASEDRAQSSVCMEEDGASISDASTATPPPRRGEGHGVGAVSPGFAFALEGEESRASAAEAEAEVQFIGTCPPPSELGPYVPPPASQPLMPVPPPLPPPLASESHDTHPCMHTQVPPLTYYPPFLPLDPAHTHTHTGPPAAASKRSSLGDGGASSDAHKRQKLLFEPAGQRGAAPISCPVCTYRNAGTRKTCEMCGSSFAGGGGVDDVRDAQRRILDSVVNPPTTA